MNKLRIATPPNKWVATPPQTHSIHTITIHTQVMINLHTRTYRHRYEPQRTQQWQECVCVLNNHVWFSSPSAVGTVWWLTSTLSLSWEGACCLDCGTESCWEDSFWASSEGVQCMNRHLFPRRQPCVTKCLHILENASAWGPGGKGRGGEGGRGRIDFSVQNVSLFGHTVLKSHNAHKTWTSGY